jgi:hypothetical protein
MLVESLFERSQATGQYLLAGISLNFSCGDKRCVTSAEGFGHERNEWSADWRGLR